MKEIGYVEIDGKNYLVTVNLSGKGVHYKLVNLEWRFIPREARYLAAATEYLKTHPDKADALLRGEIVRL